MVKAVHAAQESLLRLEETDPGGPLGLENFGSCGFSSAEIKLEFVSGMLLFLTAATTAR